MKQEFTEFSEFREADKSLMHEWPQFKDPVSHMCLAGAVVACWFVTQEVAGSKHFLQKYFPSSTDSVDSSEFI